MDVKIYGAGSVGCHFAYSCRYAGMSVYVIDPDQAALERMKNDIYPTRYGSWDNAITLSQKDVRDTLWDLVIVGTPPESHCDIALRVLSEENVKAVLIEKPLTPPDLSTILLFKKAIENTKTKIFIGYNHTLTKNTETMRTLIAQEDFGITKNIDVYFQEHWKGIFAAHPWLSGPEESYLGNSSQGGGALCEHSHGINLFQYISHITHNGRISEVLAVASIVKDKDIHYDESVHVSIVTESGLKGSVRQDVVTYPAIKKATITFEHAHMNWYINKANGLDSVMYTLNGVEAVCDIAKTRPEDFHSEIAHIQSVINGEHPYRESPIHIERGIDTMLAICAVLRSIEEKQAVKINYDTQKYDEVLTLVN